METFYSQFSTCHLPNDNGLWYSMVQPYQKTMKGGLRYSPGSHASLETICDLTVFTLLLFISHFIKCCVEPLYWITIYYLLSHVRAWIPSTVTSLPSTDIHLKESSAIMCCRHFLHHNIFSSYLSWLPWPS